MAERSKALDSGLPGCTSMGNLLVRKGVGSNPILVTDISHFVPLALLGAWKPEGGYSI